MQQQQTQEEEPEAQGIMIPNQPTSSFTATSQSTELSNVDRSLTQAAIHKLRMQARSRRKLRLVIANAPLAIYLPILFFILTGHILASSWLFIGMMLSILSLLWMIVIYPRLAARQFAPVKNTLDSLDDVRLVGQLLQALDFDTRATQPDITAAIRRLLPRLQASDAQLLNREQRTCLYRTLSNRFFEKGFILDVLKALEQIGDKEAVPYVSRVAKWSRDKDIRHEANNCLPFLLERSEEYKRGAMLLRPADARTSTPDVLLRAATETKDVKPEELLRAGSEQPPL